LAKKLSRGGAEDQGAQRATGSTADHDEGCALALRYGLQGVRGQPMLDVQLCRQFDRVQRFSHDLRHRPFGLGWKPRGDLSTAEVAVHKEQPVLQFVSQVGGNLGRSDWPLGAIDAADDGRIRRIRLLTGRPRGVAGNDDDRAWRFRCELAGDAAAKPRPQRTSPMRGDNDQLRILLASSVEELLNRRPELDPLSNVNFSRKSLGRGIEMLDGAGEDGAMQRPVPLGPWPPQG
jgi:hypothetical protein